MIVLLLVTSWFRVSLATAFLEAGKYREAETVLAAGGGSAEMLNAWSSVHLNLGQLTTAEMELREGLRITTERPASDDLKATLLHNLAAVEMRIGRYAEALGHEHDALAMWERARKPDNGKLVRGWASLASLEYMMGQVSEARTSMERALGVAAETYGARSLLMADLLDSDAIILDKLKLKKQSRRAREQALAIRGGPPARANRATWDIHEPDGAVSLRSP